SDADTTKLRQLTQPKLTLAGGAFISDRSKEAVSFGGHVAGGYRVGSATHMTLGLSGSAGGSQEDAVRRFRSGLGIAFGAPFNPNWIGVAFEAGVDATQSYHLIYTTTGETLSSQTAVAAYLQQTILVQAPLKTIRPYAGFG